MNIEETIKKIKEEYAEASICYAQIMDKFKDLYGIYDKANFDEIPSLELQRNILENKSVQKMYFFDILKYLFWAIFIFLLSVKAHYVINIITGILCLLCAGLGSSFGKDHFKDFLKVYRPFKQVLKNVSLEELIKILEERKIQKQELENNLKQNMIQYEEVKKKILNLYITTETITNMTNKENPLTLDILNNNTDIYNKYNEIFEISKNKENSFWASTSRVRKKDN